MINYHPKKLFDQFHSSLEKSFVSETIRQENEVVLNFLKGTFKNKRFSLLEVGAGLGHFLTLLNNNCELTALEVNSDLCKNLSKKGIRTINKSILKSELKSEKFDVVHCAHVLEHFGYPEITKVLDELFRLVKYGGFVIIHGPYLHPGFYNDLDHVRPYPVGSILQYFSNTQQQKVGGANIKLIKSWDRKDAIRLSHYFEVSNFGWVVLDMLLKKMWLEFGWPRGQANGYVAIFRKEN